LPLSTTHEARGPQLEREIKNLIRKVETLAGAALSVPDSQKTVPKKDFDKLYALTRRAHLPSASSLSILGHIHSYRKRDKLLLEKTVETKALIVTKLEVQDRAVCTCAFWRMCG
jgi:hypothetical protein